MAEVPGQAGPKTYGSGGSGDSPAGSSGSKTYDGFSGGETHSQNAMDKLGLGSMVSLGGLPQSLKEFTTAGLIFDYEDILNVMRLTFVNPEITETITASYEEIKTLGRTIPQFGYVNTSGRKLDLEIHFMAENAPALQVHRKVQWLKTFMYPQDSAAGTRPPKKMVVCLGMYMWLKGVVTKVSIDHKAPFGGFATKVGFLSMLPHYAVAKISLSETENFWTGGQMTYDQAMLEHNFMLVGSGLPSYVGSALMLL